MQLLCSFILLYDPLIKCQKLVKHVTKQEYIVLQDILIEVLDVIQLPKNMKSLYRMEKLFRQLDRVERGLSGNLLDMHNLPQFFLA